MSSGAVLLTYELLRRDSCTAAQGWGGGDEVDKIRVTGVTREPGKTGVRRRSQRAKEPKEDWKAGGQRKAGQEGRGARWPGRQGGGEEDTRLGG